jgi:Fe2+ or Zn2+ uptake regulation protein
MEVRFMSSLRSELKSALRGQGMRLTSQRALLLDLIENNIGHLDTHELWQLAKQRDANISLATTYRAVALFRDLGLIDEVHLAEDHHHYEARSASEHQHLICLGCGSIVEFTHPLVSRLITAVGSAHGYRIAGVTVDLTGYCPACQRQRQTAATDTGAA